MNKFLFFVLAFVVFIIMYKACILYPVFGDDWVYSYIWHSNEKPTGFIDIVYSQYKHYFTWGGRSVTHFIAQSLLMLKSTSLIAALNATVYLFLTIIVYKLATINKSNVGFSNVAAYVLVLSMLWLCTPMLSGVTMWITGSANYLWGTLIVLLFIYPYLDYLDNKPNNNKYKTITYVIPLLGVIAGWCNEATSLSIVVFLVFYIYMLRKKGLLQRWMILGFVSFALGTIIMLAAPGNYARLGRHLAEKGENTSLLETCLGNLSLLYSYVFLDSYMSMLFLLLIAFTLYYLLIQKGAVRQLQLPISAALIGSIAICIMLCSPQFPIRTMFFPFICFAISTVGIYTKIEFRKKPIIFLNYSFICILFIIYMWDANGRLNSLKDISVFWKNRVEYVEVKKKEGVVDIVFDEVYPAYKPSYSSSKYFMYDHQQTPQIGLIKLSQSIMGLILSE